MKHDTPLDFHRKRDFGEVLDVTFQFLRQNLASLAKGLLFLVAPPLVVAMLFNVAVQIRIFTGDFLSGSPETLADLQDLLFNYAAIMVFSLFAGTMAWAVILGFMRMYEAHGPGAYTVNEIWDEAKKLFFRMLGTALFVLANLFAVYVLFAFFVAAGTSVLSQVGGFLGGLFVLLALAVFLAGLVYVLTIVAILFPMRAFEPIGIIEGLSRSLSLVKGYWWQTFGVIFIAWLISSVLGGIFSMPSVFLSFVQGMNTLEGGNMVLRVLLVVSGVLGGMANALLYSIPMLATGFQYFNLLERKEGVGLMARIEQMAEHAGREGGEGREPEA